MSKALTPRQRNERWAKNNKELCAILEMEVDDYKTLDEQQVHKRTLSIVERFAFPDRKYKHKRVRKEEPNLYFLIRVK